MLQHKKNHVRKHGKKTTAKQKSYLAFFHSAPGKAILLISALLLAIYLVLFFLPKSAMSPEPNLTEKQAQTLSKAKISTTPFIENRGQANELVRYYSQLQNGTFFVDQQGQLTYNLGLTTEGEIRRSLRNARRNREEEPAGMARRSYVIKESFQTDEPISIIAAEPSQVSINSIIGNDESKWQQNIPAYNVLDLGEVYKGVKVRLQAATGNIEKIFEVLPQADVQNIRLQLAGADKLAINAQGELEMQTSEGTFKFTKPLAWQEIDGQKQKVEASYRLIDSNTYGFEVGQYDKNYALTIDPLLVTSYLGGTNWEGLREVLGGNNAMVIANGSLYVTAYTYSTDFPTTAGAYDRTMGGGNDVFISKISLDLGTLQASTFLGGSTNGESESVITADTSGNIFVAGNTYSSDFPGTTGRFQPGFGGGKDGFIAKLNGDLTSLQAATYIGAASYEWMNGLAYDPTGYIYAAIDARSDFPTTPINASAGYDTSFYGTNSNLAIVRLDENLSANYYTMTYIGGRGYYGALARDSAGKLFVTGGCVDNVPVVRANGFTSSYQETIGGSCDSFVARFSADLTTLEASTIIGGPNWENDYTETIAVRGSGASEQVFVIGDTSGGAETTGGGLKATLNNNPRTVDTNPSPTERIMTFGPLSSDYSDDIYILRFNRDLQTANATIIGGSDQDNCPFLSLDSEGEVYITASTYSNDIPITAGAFDTTGSNFDMEIYAAKLNNDLTELLGSTYFGGTNDENYSHIIVDETSGYDVAYLVGETYSSDVPGTTNGFQPTYAGNGDLYIAAFTCAFAKVCPATSLAAIAGNTQVSLSWTAPLGNVLPIVDYEIHYSDDGFNTDDQIFVDGVSTLTTTVVTGLVNGTNYSFRVYAKDSASDLSRASNTATATPAGTAPPAAITDLSAAPGDAEAYLDWSAPANYGNPISSYEVHYSNDGFVSNNQICNTTSCTDTTPGADVAGLVNDTLYSFRVYAINVNGPSAVSNTATTTPLANAINASVEVHISEVNPYLVFSPNVYNTISSGISDNANGAQDFNVFGTPRSDKFTGLIPPLARAVRYSFYLDGSVLEHDGITYSAEDMTGATNVSLADDALSGNILLGFTTTLFGRAVDTIKISSNGFIYANQTAVTATNSGCCGGQNFSTLSGAGLVGPDIIIAGDWADLYPPGAGTIKYKTIGTTPDRIFVVEFDNVSPCCDATGGNSFQIKIFESGQSAAAPQITGIVPDNGPIAGGTNVVISGTGFAVGATVTFGDTPATNIVVLNSSTITATTDTHVAGLVNVKVTNPDLQEDILVDGFEYLGNPAPNLNYCAGYTNIYGNTMWPSGSVYNIGLSADQTAWWWGYFSSGTTPSTTPQQLIDVTDIDQISVSDYRDFTLVLKTDGTVWGWGDNSYGQLGDNSTTYRDAPVQVSGLTGVQAVNAGDTFSIALKTDGTVWAWGDNGNGQLGDGSYTESHVPVQVSGLTGIDAIAEATYHTLALKNDGSLWSWGTNWSGQLGDGTFDTRNTPYQVFGAGSGITDIVVGEENSYILKSDGTLWAWGANWAGQIGNGSTNAQYTPILVGGPTVTAIFSDYYNTFAILDDGSLWGWGYNSNGQLGLGDYSNRLLPVQITAISGAEKVFTGSDQTFVVLTDGTLRATGVNGNGQLGNGTYDDSAAFVQTSGINNVSSVVPGQYRTLALKNDGTIWAWGQNNNGQFGNGTLNNSTVPVQTRPPCTNVSPSHGPYTGGTVVTLTGSGFQVGATVTFGGLFSTGVTVLSDTQITATTPAHAIGPVDIVVTNPDSQSSTYRDGFTYMALQPTVTGIDPDNGSSHTFTPVNITGTDFISGATVTFDTTPASNVVFQDSTTLTVDAPPHAAGTVDVTVTNPDLQSATLPNSFTYSGTPDLQITDLNSSDQYYPTIITTSDGNYLIVWQDFRNSGTSNSDIYAQKIDGSTGDIIWNTYLNGRDISTHPGYQPYYFYHVKVVADDNGGAFIVWDTNTTWSNVDIYVDYIDSDGAFHTNWESGGYPGINVSAANTYADQNPSIIYDGTGGVYVSWTKYNGSWPNYDIVVTHLDATTAAPTAGWPVTINNTGYDDGSQIIPTGDGGIYIVTWTYPDNLLYVQKYNSAGVLQAPFNPMVLSTLTVGDGSDYKAVSDGAGGLKIAYVYDDGTGGESIRTLHINSTGSYVMNDTEVDPGIGTQVGNMKVLNSVDNNLYIVYQYSDEGLGNTPIYANRISPTGQISERLTVADYTAQLPDSNIHNFFLSEDGYGGVMVTHTHRFGANQYVGITQLDINNLATSQVYGLENTDVGFPTITMNGSVGAVSWYGTTATSGGYKNIFARLISSTAPLNIPTISSIAPNNGPLEGGTSISVTGTNFEDGNTSITFMDTRSACTNLVFVSTTNVTCTTTAGSAPGPVDVDVATSQGNSTLANAFTYTVPNHDTIEIHSTIPAEPDNFGVGISNGDDLDGYTDINFTGAPTSAGLDGAESYSFNAGAPTRAVITQNFESRTWINVLENFGGGLLSNEDDKYSTNIPLNFTVTLYGREMDTVRITSNGFVYLNSSANLQGTDTAPGVGYSMTDYANLPDGTDGTATGDILVAGAWGDLDVTKTGDDVIRYYLDSANEVLIIDFLNVEHVTGPGNIRTQIKIKGNQATGDSRVPTIDSIVPNQGPLSGRNSVTVTGTNYLTEDPPVITFGGPTKICENRTILSTTSLTCTVPAGAALGSVDVTVTSSSGFNTLTNGYTYRTGIGEAQWPTVANPSPVIVDDGVGWSWDGRIVRTSDGNFVTVIEGDAESHVNAQKINPAGQKLWNGGNPQQILNANAYGLFDVLPDSNGGIFIAHGGDWIGLHSSYVSRMDTDGTVLWTAGPFETNAGFYDLYPRVTSDGNDGVYVTWSTYDWIPSPEEVHMTHLGPDGNVCEVGNCGIAWNAGGSGTYRPLALPVGTLTMNDHLLYPVTTPSDNGSVIVTYLATTTPDYYFVKINPDGSNDWGPTGTYLSVSDADVLSYMRDDYVAEPDGSGGIFMAYGGDDGVDFTVRIVRIDSNGNFVLGSASGGMIASTTTGRWDSNLHSTSENDGNLYLVWNNYPPRVQKYDGSGTELWQANGVSITQNDDPNLEDYVETNYRYYTDYTTPIAPDGLGGLVVVGRRNSLVYGDYITVFAQRVTSDGDLDWGNSFSVNKYPYYDGAWADYNEKVVSDGNGGAVIFWNRYDHFGEDVAPYDYYSAVQYVKAGVLGTPEIYDINATEGLSTGGTNVIIRGLNFTDGTTVTFDGVPATYAVTASSNVIVATTPAHAPGLVDVTVTTTEGNVRLTNGYTYLGPAPTVTDATPGNGTIAGGTIVTLTGTGFQTGATVDFDGVNGTNVIVDSATRIRVTTPPHTLGLTSITVTNTDTQFGTLEDSFTFINTPPPSLQHCVDYTTMGIGPWTTQGTMAGITPWNWGYNNNYQLGDGSTLTRNYPVQPTGLTGNFIKFESGHDASFPFTVALRDDGTVWGWGTNSRGELGDGTFNARTTPVQALGLSGITDIKAGYSHTVALKNDGTVWTWGYNNTGAVCDNTYNNRNTPAAISGITTAQEITVNSYTTHFRLSDGTVWGCGYNFQGMLGDFSNSNKNYPVQTSGLTTVTSLSSGYGGHNLALKSDGTVWAWGYGFNGEMGNGSSTNRFAPVQVYGPNGVGYLANITKVYTGNFTSYALRDDNTVWAWGWNAYGQLGNNSGANSNVPVQVQGITGTIQDLFPSWRHTFALLTDGTAMGWGYNLQGQVGNGTSGNFQYTAVPVTGLSGISKIKAEFYHSAALKNDGTLWNWGENNNGQLGNGNFTSASSPIQPSYTCSLGLSPDFGPVEGGTSVTISGANFDPLAEVTIDGNATEVVYIDEHTLTISTPAHPSGPGPFDLRVTNPDGQFDTLPFTYTSDLPTITNVTPNSGRSSGGTAVTITGTNFIGGTYSVEFDTNLCTDVLVLTDTTLTCTTPASSLGYEGLVDVRIITIYGSDTLVDGFTYTAPDPTIDSIYPDQGPTAGGSSVMITGSNFTDADQDVNLSVAFDGIACTNISPAADGNSLTCTTPSHALGAVDVVVTTDYGTDTLVGGYTYATTPAPDLQACTGFVDVQSGGGHTVALASNGTVWAWGWNWHGQLGNGTNTDSSTPVQVRGLSGVTAIYANGGDYTLALKNDGTVWAWGRNFYGQLGNGSKTDSNIPVPVRGLTNVTAISVESGHAMALRADGTAWAWGRNSYGSLGDGTDTDRDSITRVSGLTDVSAIYMGWGHAIATKNDGTIWAWGRNDYGQLGTATRTDPYLPSQVIGLTNVSSIKLGNRHSLALKNDGTVWAWGDNWYGQIGNGNGGAENTQPTAVQVLTGASTIEAGAYYSYAIKNDGTVWSWGDNWAGQLGDGTFVEKQIPTKALKLSGITNIDTSWYEFTLARKNDGTVWAWGYNGDGAVGDGTLTDRNTPVQVGSPLTNVSKLSAYDTYSIILKTDGTVWAWGYNGAGALGDGTLNDSLTPVQSLAATCHGITPDTGTFLGGTPVTINGTNFMTGATVTFDGVPATGVTVENANTITATTPAHAAGAVDVVVTNPDTQFDRLTDGYLYTDQPTVESVVPNSGPSAGGQTVTLTGVNYFAGATVTFNGVQATGVTVVSDTEITCVTPAHPLGVVDVAVTTTNGTGTMTNAYSYVAAPGVPGEWPTGGIPIDGHPIPDEPVQSTPYTITASDGDFIVGWVREGLDADDDIAVQKIDAETGTYLWPDDGAGSGGMRISDRGTTTYNQAWQTDSPTPLVPDNNGGAYVIWKEIRTGAAPITDLMLQRVGSDSSLIYGNNPKNLSNNPGATQVNDYAVISDGAGGVYVAWTDYNTVAENTQVRMKRVTAAGIEYTVNTALAFPVDSHMPRLALDSSNKAYIAYLVWNNIAGIDRVTVRRIASDGSIPALGQDWFNAYQLQQVTDEVINQYAPVVDANNDIIIIYSSQLPRADYTISAQKINRGGESSSWFTPGVGGLELATVGPFDSPLFLQAVSDGADGAIAAWMLAPSGRIFAQKVDGSGTVLWNAGGLEASDRINRANMLRNLNSLVGDGFGGAILTYDSAYRVASNRGLIAALFGNSIAHAAMNIFSNWVHLQKINSAGTILWPSGAATDMGFTDFSDYTDGDDYYPAIAGDGAGGAAMFWIGNNNTSTFNDLYGQYYRETTIPTVSSVVPNYGPTGGGTSVTITGTNFDGPGIVVWFDNNQCVNTTVVNANTITCETPAHAAGAVDIMVVGTAGSDTLVDGYTYGDEIICTSDGINTFCGTQNVGGCPTTTTGFTAGPDNFQFGSLGSRNVTGINDTAHVEATNGAYFEETTPSDFSDTTDTLTINSNTSEACGSEGTGVTLSVSATPFRNLSPEDLVTYGADHLPGGTGSDEDYYGMLSVFTSGEATCTDTCVPAIGNVESSNEVKNGQDNFFANATANDSTLSAGFDATSVLLDSTNTPNTVVLYDASTGFNGEVTIPGLDYVLAIPANIQFRGSFSSTVTYTLS